MNRVGFLRPIKVARTGEYDADGRPIWELLEDLCFYSLKLGGVWVITPAGFHTNFASVPRVPFAYLWYGDICWEEPAAHDFPYTAPHVLHIVPGDRWIDYSLGLFQPLVMDCSKELADELFLEALRANPRIPNGSAHTMHRAVKWFGKSSWDAPSTVPQPASLGVGSVGNEGS
jgi:hypothetical protein